MRLDILGPNIRNTTGIIMKYLEKFILMDEDRLADTIHAFVNIHDQDEYFPLGFFSPRLKELDFEEITILYGGNGSGKSTLLNLIAEKAELHVQREREWTQGFKLYLEHCTIRYARGRRQTRALPPGSKILASDNIFEQIITRREENLVTAQYKTDAAALYDNQRHVRMRSLADYERLGEYNEVKSKSRVGFMRDRAGRKSREFSNGEQALRFFDGEIEENALYLLDEPENSMSAVFQLELKKLIAESARFFNCQFVIATHSPFILSLPGAKIYNLDARPVTIEDWTALENVKAYAELFAPGEA